MRLMERPTVKRARIAAAALSAAGFGLGRRDEGSYRLRVSREMRHRLSLGCGRRRLFVRARSGERRSVKLIIHRRRLAKR